VSDIRFIIIGAGLIFAGIIIMSVFGSEHTDITLQAQFGDCYDYHDDKPPTEIDCDIAFQDKMIFFALVVMLIVCGIVAIIKGIRGVWDQDVKPEDMVGPGHSFDTRDDNEDYDETDKND
jgi:hypothetical protein|tara:strand:- start:128 stop:487 length:360 start_codon:yes stop_codon:yes gene_type:complete